MPLDMDAIFSKYSKTVELISSCNYHTFIYDLEVFINRKDIAIVDLKYSTCVDKDDCHWNKALIFYKELDSGNSDGD